MEAIPLLLLLDPRLPLCSLGMCQNRVVAHVSSSGICSSLTLPCIGGFESTYQWFYDLWLAGECYHQIVHLLLGSECGQTAWYTVDRAGLHGTLYGGHCVL